MFDQRGKQVSYKFRAAMNQLHREIKAKLAQES